jgi:hypothetical protein
MTDYSIGGMRKGGRTYRAATYITPAYFYEPIDVYTLSSWSSFSYQTYSYTEYVSYYSEEIYTSYERSETYIAETITDTTFVSEMTSETNYEFSSYDEQIVDGSYVEGGSGSVWQDGETDVVYDPADDPTLLEVPLDSAADDVDPFTADQGDPDYDAAALEADAGETDDPALYGDSGAGTSDAAPQEPVLSEDPPSEDTAVPDDPAAAQDPAMVEDSTATEGPAAPEDPASSEDPATYQDPAPEDPGYTDQPSDVGSMDEASADPICAGEIVDGACVEPSDAGGGDGGGYADTSGGDTGGYQDTSSADSAGYEDTGGGEEYIPEQ